MSHNKAEGASFLTSCNAVRRNDEREFNRALNAEKDPGSAVLAAEHAILVLFHEVGEENSPARRMLTKAIQIITKAAPRMVGDGDFITRADAIRALTVAEAASEWKGGILHSELRETRGLIENIPPSNNSCREVISALGIRRKNTLAQPIG